jgi:hypothetical protein
VRQTRGGGGGGDDDAEWWATMLSWFITGV